MNSCPPRAAFALIQRGFRVIVVRPAREGASVEPYKQQFIDFMLRSGALKFGDFVTKSGRNTPFFINLGLFNSGSRIAQLGDYYALALRDRFGDDFDCLFGPAYKAIPLVVAASIALARHHERDVPFCFNRKEAKDHGEGGNLVGHIPAAGQRVVIVEDVTTAGTSVRETRDLLAPLAGVRLVGLLVAVDRQERGPTGKQSALAALRDDLGLATHAIVTLDEILAHLQGRRVGGKLILTPALLSRIEAYRRQYGAAE